MKVRKLGRYELFDRLGTGGMASVYLGRLRVDSGFERWVAVKCIHEHLSDDPVFLEMFLEEARVTFKLNHPKLVQVTDVAVEDGRPYLVMEYVRGKTLSAILKSCRSLEIRFPIPFAVRIIAWACEGLHHAHELRDMDGTHLQLVHRDLSPHNILVSYDGNSKVADFGIAIAAGRNALTQTGFIKGKPQYMSPEQALAKPLDRRSDIFSLGTVLWEATVGRRLFLEESDLETFRRITSGDVPRPRDLERSFPAQLEATILKALHVDPNKRHPTTRAFQQELEAYLIKTGNPVTSGDISEFLVQLYGDQNQANVDLHIQAHLNAPSSPPESPKMAIKQNHDPLEISLKTPRSFEPPSNPSASDSLPLFVMSRTRLLMILVASMLALGGGALVGMAISERTSSQNHSSEMTKIPEKTQSNSHQYDDIIDKINNPDESSIMENAEGNIDYDFQTSLSDDPLSESETSGDDSSAVLVFTAEEVAKSTKGKRQWKQHLKRGPHQKRTIKATPQGSGTLNVITRPWCEVALDGRSLGRTPLMNVKVSAGQHVLTFFPRGERPGHRRVIRVRPDEITPLSVDLR